MNENIIVVVVRLDEAETFRRLEPPPAAITIAYRDNLQAGYALRD
jgi:hypothetical protein